MERPISRRTFIAGVIAAGALGTGTGPETPQDVAAIWGITNDLLIHGVRPPAVIHEFAPPLTELTPFFIPPDIAQQQPKSPAQAIDMVHTALHENGLTGTIVNTTHDPQAYARIERPGYIIEGWNPENEAELPMQIVGLLRSFSRQPQPFLKRSLPNHIVIAPSVKKINTNECSRMEEPYHGVGGFFRPSRNALLLAQGYTYGFAPAHELFHGYVQTLATPTARALFEGAIAISKRAFHGENPYREAYECNGGMLKRAPILQVFTREYSSKSAEEDLANVYADIVQGSMIVDEQDTRWNTEYHLKQQLLLRHLESTWPTITNSFRAQGDTV